ncbi:MAG: hypothetical protein EBW19_01355 [Betaproteobacteria bacterium]|nr:hypothetical protein [Betaproteobacteria bacterium]
MLPGRALAAEACPSVAWACSSVAEACISADEAVVVASDVIDVSRAVQNGIMDRPWGSFADPSWMFS